MTTLAIAAATLLAAAVAPDLLEWQRCGAPWRVLTCHFVHYSAEHRLWDLIAFAALGVACERRHRAAFHATLAAGAIAIPAAVLAFTQLHAYRGLSGIDAALFALLVTLERKQWPMLACAALFGAKLAFELFTGGGVFVSDLGPGVVAVPVAHLAGALAGVVCGAFAVHNHATPCASSSS